MEMDDLVESLKNFDFEQNVGSWPLAVKAMCWVFAFVGVITLGYLLKLQDMQKNLKRIEGKEVTLRKEYEDKAMEAVLLEDYEKQQKEMEETFENILRQLPTQTEIPGLIEDITTVGLKNKLSIQSIKLQDEKKHEYYIEKPIQIVVRGSYHDLGAFVSDVADLSRIVTLQNFSLQPIKAKSKSKSEKGRDVDYLQMSITAKTYRYSARRG